MIGVEIIIVLSAIVVGTRLKGISLGIMGGLGLAILTFCFQLQPSEPPFDVLLIITAVVIAASALEASGGLSYLTNIVEKLIRQYPSRITFISPLATYLLTFLGGTGHTVYSILPVVATVARETGIRPERPMSATVIAAQQAVIASPISAPTAMVISLLSPHGIGLLDILQVLVPATLGGVILATTVVNKLGKELDQDPVYLQRIQANTQVSLSQDQLERYELKQTAKLALGLFSVGMGLIILFGIFENLRPSWEVDGKIIHMAMPTIIAVMMLAIAALIVLLCRLQPSEITKSSVFTTGIQAVIAILGISWLGDTFVKAHQHQIIQFIETQILQYPWQFSIIMFLVSILLVSQTATIRTLVPLGLALGIPPITVLAILPASNGLFVVPSYPTIIAAINLDSTGTTRVGKFILNHSFMIPGLIATTTALLIALVLVRLLF